MLDIHAHIIPGVDDGSKNLDDSIRMIESLIADGVTEVIATPHYAPARGYTATRNDITLAYDELVLAVKSRNLPISIQLGQEIFYSEYDDILGKLRSGDLLTLNGSRYVLIEFAQSKQPEQLFEFVYNLSVNGYIPVIAHIERYKWMNEELASELKDEGCLLQINSDSVFSLFSGRKCNAYIKNGLVDFIAGDIHSIRKTCMKKAVKKYNFVPYQMETDI